MKMRRLVVTWMLLVGVAAAAGCSDDDGTTLTTASAAGGYTGATATGGLAGASPATGGSQATGGSTSGGTGGEQAGGTGGQTSGGTGGTGQTGGDGGTEQAAGAGGAAGAAGAPPISNCAQCIEANCQAEFSGCTTDLCIHEFQCTQLCIGAKISATQALTQQDKDDCVSECAMEALADSIPGADGSVSAEMDAIYTCINTNPWCAHYCYGDPEPP